MYRSIHLLKSIQPCLSFLPSPPEPGSSPNLRSRINCHSLTIAPSVAEMFEMMLPPLSPPRCCRLSSALKLKRHAVMHTHTTH